MNVIDIARANWPMIRALGLVAIMVGGLGAFTAWRDTSKRLAVTSAELEQWQECVGQVTSGDMDAACPLAITALRDDRLRLIAVIDDVREREADAITSAERRARNACRRAQSIAQPPTLVTTELPANEPTGSNRTRLSADGLRNFSASAAAAANRDRVSGIVEP